MKGKKLTFILSILLAAALVSLAAAADLPQGPAHHSHTAVTLQSQSQSQFPRQSQTQEQAKTFTGKVTKSNGRYVLEDETMNSTYYLDDTKSAQKYEGKNVKVTGTLDSANNTIHVQKIEAV
jgi:lipopolysaccharide export system protein LptA